MTEYKCPTCGEPAPTWDVDTWRNEAGSWTHYILPCRHAFTEDQWSPKPTIEYEIRLPLRGPFSDAGRTVYMLLSQGVSSKVLSLYVWSDGVVTAKDER